MAATQNNPLGDFVSYFRTTGATRTNAAGLIVGVDFSTTSNTINTGSKTFTLTAGANVNRDWAVGSDVIAVSQAGVTGSMTGTVTSYISSTQQLVIEVTSISGSGTSTDWRIGSLEMRTDPVSGGAVSEPATTNLVTFSEQFDNAIWVKNNATVSANASISPDGSINMDRLTSNGASFPGFYFTATVTSGTVYTFSLYYKVIAQALIADTTGGVDGLLNRTKRGLVIDHQHSSTGGGVSVTDLYYEDTQVATGIYRRSVTFLANASGTRRVGAYFIDNVNGNTASGRIYDFWGGQLELNGLTSYNPTTGTQVTRGQDFYSASAKAVAAFRRSGQGAIYATVTCNDNSVTQKKIIEITENNTTNSIVLAKRGTNTTGKFAEQSVIAVDNTIYFPTESGGGTNGSLMDDGKSLKSLNIVNERTGLVTQLVNIGAWAYDGASKIALQDGSEVFLEKDLSKFGGVGFGGNQINGGRWNGSRFIFSCSTTGVVFLSDNGITWRRVNTPVISNAGQGVGSMLVGGIVRNVLVAFGGIIATSDDNGETWTARTSGTTNNLTGVNSGGGIFLITRQAANTSNMLMSTNGIDWVNVVSNGTVLFDVAYDGTNRFVSVGANGNIQTATITNGVLSSWTPATLSPTSTAQFNTIHFANGLWVAAGNGGVIYTSTNGTAFTARNSQITNIFFKGTFFNGLHILAGESGVIRTSPDGITWTGRTSGVTNNIGGCTTNGTRVVITGLGGAVVTSENGIDYTSRTNNNAVVYGIAYGNNTFVSVGATANGSAYIATIDNNKNYTRRVSNTDATQFGVKFLNGAFYSVGNGTSVLRSVNGIDWTTVNAVLGTSLFSVTFGNGTYVAIGAGGRIVTSTNGTTWSGASLNNGASTESMYSINFANGLFVAVGNLGTIITSTTGLPGSYVLRTSGTTQNLHNIIYSSRDQLWYAAGALGTILVSENGATWRPYQNAGQVSLINDQVVNFVLPEFTSGQNTVGISFRSDKIIAGLNGQVLQREIASGNGITDIGAVLIGENLNGIIHSITIKPAFDQIGTVQFNT